MENVILISIAIGAVWLSSNALYAFRVRRKARFDIDVAIEKLRLIQHIQNNLHPDSRNQLIQAALHHSVEINSRWEDVTLQGLERKE